MAEKSMNKIIGEAFLDIAESIETGRFGRKIRIGLTTLGSEIGSANMIDGALLALNKVSDLEVVLIGEENTSDIETVIVENEEEMYSAMEKLLDDGDIDACVTLHYNFPIGVSTVGKVITPGMGRELFIATTTGTSAIDRSQSLFANALFGIIAAKACGIKNPSVGILNIDNAKNVERALKKLDENGYPINFGESIRSDGGSIMRGNDLLSGSVNVMVTDTLTGNILMKVFSSYTTGGSYESLGYGYGPGIGIDYNRNILIVSRASGVPVIAGALQYAYELSKHNLDNVRAVEIKNAMNAGYQEIFNSLKKTDQQTSVQETIKEVPKEIVTASISGIDIMELEDAVIALKSCGIYAESGMGCTGAVIMVNESNFEKALECLSDKEFIAIEKSPC